jgi:hypothetical protein
MKTIVFRKEVSTSWNESRKPILISIPVTITPAIGHVVRAVQAGLQAFPQRTAVLVNSDGRSADDDGCVDRTMIDDFNPSCSITGRTGPKIVTPYDGIPGEAPFAPSSRLLRP